jgi:Holliday junction DNA helicase RuvA
MIARLTGMIVAEEGDGTLVIDVGGVGYEVLAPLGTVGRMRANAPTGPLTFHVHTHVREDAFTLFGFGTALDREVFRTLLSISNVGPKIALAVLSSLPSSELSRVVARKELARLTSIPGVGKKTAERLLLELRDKLPAPRAGEADTPRAAAPAKQGARDLLLGALTSMGYKPQEAERAAEQLGDKVDELPLADAIREALRVLARLGLTCGRRGRT